MKKYYSTFITGFSEVVKQALLSRIKDVKIDLLSDGLVIYKTSADTDTIKQLRFFNNSFLLLQQFPKLGANPINEMFRQVIRNKSLISVIHNYIPMKNTAFRVMATIENQFVSMDKNLLGKLESIISQEKGLILNRSKPDIEFLFAVRREGYGLFGLRLTRHTSYEKILEKGEIYPELAHILCLISEPKADDAFLDPFCGSGAIPLARAKGFPYKTIYASDIEKVFVDKVRNKANNLKSKVVVEQCNALKLRNISNNSIDKVVTDPPWGIYLGKELNLEQFYQDMLMELWRVLRPDGLLVVMVANKDLFETVLDKFSDKLGLLIRFDTLVSGQKAGVFKIKKL